MLLRTRTPPPLSAALRRLAAAAFFAAESPQPPPLSPQLVDAAVSRCPSDALALSFFLWCARRPGYFHPAASFDRVLPAAARLASRLRTVSAVVDELRSVGCPIKAQTFLVLLRVYWRGGLYPLALEVFDEMSNRGFEPNAFARNVVLDVLLRAGRFDAATWFLQETREPNYLTYAIVLSHLCRAGNWSAARGCFVAMVERGFHPSSGTLAAVFGCCSKAGSLPDLLQLTTFVVVSGGQLTPVMWTSLICCICHEGTIDEACRMLVKMAESGCSPTVVTYTLVIRGLFQAGKHGSIHELFNSMTSFGCSPDLVLYNVLMDCFSKEERYDDALAIYLHLLGGPIKPDTYSLSTLVRMLQSSGNMDLLPRLIAGTDISYDIVTCNSLLHALCKTGFPSKAIQFYVDMVSMGITPDNYSYVGLLDGLCQTGRIDHAISAYHSIFMNNPDTDAYVHAAILRGLVKRGQNCMAFKIFRDALCKNYALDVVCYTIVIHGLFQAQLTEEVCNLFQNMKQSGIAPNTCTYNVMLRGFCRTRDMDAVKQLLREMDYAGIEMDSISFNTVIVLLIKLKRVSSSAVLVRTMLELGMKPTIKTYSLLSRSLRYKFVAEADHSSPELPHYLEDCTITESDGSDSSNELLVCSAS